VPDAQTLEPAPEQSAGWYRIGKAFTFEASHRLGASGSPRRCARDHGHSYTVGVVLAARELVGPGFVTDFGDLDPFKRYLADTFDHRRLNDVLGVEPTRQGIERHLAAWLAANLVPHVHGRLQAVRVSDRDARSGRAGRTYRFEAAHRLAGLPDGHKCAREHGHSYAVGVALDSDAAVPEGFVGDFGAMELLEDYVAGNLSGDLNAVLDVEPTSERIAEHLAGWFADHVAPQIGDQLRSVWVSETPATWASFSPDVVS
jgi:6-pyruvoyltetrahydropterin/6-carboxytetrahydropterin synthase